MTLQELLIKTNHVFIDLCDEDYEQIDLFHTDKITPNSALIRKNQEVLEIGTSGNQTIFIRIKGR